MWLNLDALLFLKLKKKQSHDDSLRHTVIAVRMTSRADPCKHSENTYPQIHAHHRK